MSSVLNTFTIHHAGETNESKKKTTTQCHLLIPPFEMNNKNKTNANQQQRKILPFK